MTLQQFITTILAAVNALNGLVPVKDAIEALVKVAVKHTAIPKHEDGTDLTEAELNAAVAAAAVEAHQAWHAGDATGTP